MGRQEKDEEPPMEVSGLDDMITEAGWGEQVNKFYVWECDVCGTQIETIGRILHADHPEEFHESDERGRFIFETEVVR